MRLANGTIWKSEQTEQLARVLADITDAQEMQEFLRDVLTENEIIETSARFEAARLLNGGEKYTDVIKKTKLSSRTVARISQWMKNGRGGYANAIKLANNHHSHIPSVHAE